MWSSASPRFRAAWIATSRFSLTLFWPTYSTSFFGRSDNSKGASSSAIAPATTRFATLFLCQNLKGALEQDVKARVFVAVDGSTNRCFGRRPGIPEVFESRQHICFDNGLRRFRAEILQFVFQLDNDSLGGLLADAGNRRQPREIA